MIDKLSALIPASLLPRSGKVFYSGSAAFSSPSQLYILGLNPGGSPLTRGSETVECDAKTILEKSANWSAYRDESWEGKRPATHGMQPRVLWLLRQLNRDPGNVPASNLVFERSARAVDIGDRFRELAELCWPFHQSVIEHLGVRVVLCFGKRCGECVRKRLKATNRVDEFVENNNRKWKSTAFMNPDGIAVVVATHPSIADWTKAATDPTPLVQRMLERD